MLNYLWMSLMLASVAIGAYEHRLPAIVASVATATHTAVTISLALAGMMALWLGLMQIAEESGLLRVLGKALTPLLRPLFRDVPPDHPAMGAIVMNLTGNCLGLGNAATPFGIRAMEELSRLNPHPGTATHSMCMLLAMNTSSLQLVPATGIAILAASGATNPTLIVIPTLVATTCSTCAAIVMAKTAAYLSSRRGVLKHA